MEILYLAFCMAFILLIWFKSDALVMWGGLVGLSKFLHIAEYDDKKFEYAVKGYPYSYPQFLKDKYNYNFLSTLIGCPLCLSVWLSILDCGLIAIYKLAILWLFMIPPVCIISLILYGIVTFLLKLP